MWSSVAFQQAVAGVVIRVNDDDERSGERRSDAETETERERDEFFATGQATTSSCNNFNAIGSFGDAKIQVIV